MFDIGAGELMLIGIIVIFLFGPEKLPEFAKMVSKGMGKMKQAQDALKDGLSTIQTEMKFDLDLDAPHIPKRRDQIYINDLPTIPASELEVKNLNSSEELTEKQNINKENTEDKTL